MPLPGPCYFVVFGAMGHLASTRLLPSLYALERAGHLPDDLRLLAFARRDWTREQWLRHLTETLEKQAGAPLAGASAERFRRRFDYVHGDLYDPEAYRRLLAQMSAAHAGVCDNAAFYLAVPPADFDDTVEQLARAGCGRSHGGHRIVVEKPFGEDIESAQRLNRLLHRYFDEAQIYRIDHYLGKETVQNLFVFRFANTLVEPVWNRNYVDHVQITVAETSGIGRRAGYYDRTGALRDMVQNHLLQLLAIAAMEPPARFDADALRDEKAKVLRAIRPIDEDEVPACAVRAQYGAGMIDGTTVPGYRDEPNVPRDSATETYAAVRLHIDNWRWRGVPFYLRTGKRLAQKLSLVAIRFRRPPQLLFRGTGCAEVEPNWMVLSIQPKEAMQVEIQAKQPGAGLVSRPIRLDALYRAGDGPAIEAYQALLLDIIQGDRTLFLRFDEVEWAWRAIDPILRRWQRERGDLRGYPAGSWGPAEADRVLERADQRWRGLE
jgi:glucose-6-phosphate 1-dehydrogenase